MTLHLSRQIMIFYTYRYNLKNKLIKITKIILHEQSNEVNMIKQNGNEDAKKIKK